MPKGKDVSVTSDLKITPEDFSDIADSIVDEWKSRKDNRKDTEKIWDEIDRQIAMTPECSHKEFSSGQPNPDLEWLPETELPLQAETLEVLTSDARRLAFPKNRDFFLARAALSDKYLSRYANAGSPIVGEKADIGELHSELNQDNADRLAAGMSAHWHAQYDFRGHIDQINAQTFKYGFGTGRLRSVKRRILGYDARPSGPIEQKIPVLVPRDVRHVYLDDNVTSIMHEGHMVGPNIIQDRTVNSDDLVAAAKSGGDDPRKEDGGYIINEINKLEKTKDDTVDLVELEGDLIVDKSDSTILVRDVIVTVAVGSSKGASTTGFIRYRRGRKFSTYYVQQYHMEGSEFPAGVSPLMKGMPIARIAAQIMNRIIESGQLKSGPPVAWEKDDMTLSAEGGPKIHPYAQWPTTDLNGLKPYTELGGDPTALWQVFVGLMNMYADMTGVTPPRLGAQTKSHTTAFAKDVELNQGAVRTVDFVNTVLEGPMTRFLQIEYALGLSLMRGRHTIFIEPWNEFVSITRRHLPDIVRFLAIGSGAPAEDQARTDRLLSSAQFAIQLDRVAQQQGQSPSINVAAMIRQVLDKGGWTDVEDITTGQSGAVPDTGTVPGLVSGRPEIIG